MSADFFRKRIIPLCVAVVTVCIVIGVYFYTQYLDKATIEAVSQNYYFLISNETYTEAGAYDIVHDGGAGYVLEYGGEEYIAFASYLSQATAEKVQSGLVDDTKIVELRADTLYFKNKEDKKNAKKIVGSFQTFSNYIEILDREIARLEKGGTQESCKRILSILEKQFDYLEEEYMDTFASFSLVCNEAKLTLQELAKSTIMLSDLRSLQCEWCQSYIRLSKEFSL